MASESQFLNAAENLPVGVQGDIIFKNATVWTVLNAGTSGQVLESKGASANPVFGGAIVPIGGILPWAKSISGIPALPSQFVECNGQTLSDADSPINGEVIPDYNGFTGTPNYLRGGGNSDGSTAVASSGASDGGTEQHQHSGNTGNASDDFTNKTTTGTPSMDQHTHPFTTGNTATLPTYASICYIMRIK